MATAIARLLRTLICLPLLGLALAASASAATLHVNITTDPDNGVGACASGGSCSLREAVNQANSTGGDTIDVPAGTYTLESGDGPLSPTNSMTIVGAGASSTLVSGGGGTEILDVSAGSVTVSGVTLEDGSANVGEGGAVNLDAGASLGLQDVVVKGSSADGGGGGIQSEGTLSIDDSTITDNITSTGYGGGLELQDATGHDASTTITDSTVSDNKASEGAGGGIDEQGAQADQTVALTVDASTVSGNSAARGGGISDSYGGLGGDPATFALTDSTIAGNSATTVGGGLDIGNGPSVDPLVNDTVADNSATSAGGDIEVGGGAKPTALNTIVAGGNAPTDPDCTGGTLTSKGHNLDQQDNCGFDATSDNTDVTSPDLGSLAENGGPTETVALKSGSPAINAGSNTGCPASDQRGVARPQGGTCDIGAFEYAPPVFGTVSAAASVTTTSATLPLSVKDPDVEPGTVVIQYGTSTTYGSSSSTIDVGAGDQVIQDVTLSGLTPDTAYDYRVVAADPDGEVTATGAFTTAVPSNDFTLGRVKVAKTGKLTAKLTAPDAGKFTAKATFRYRTTVVTHRHGKRHVSHETRTETYGKGDATATGKGVKTLTLKLSTAAAKELSKLGHATVTLSVSFTPAHGKRRTKTASLTVRHHGAGKGTYS